MQPDSPASRINLSLAKLPPEWGEFSSALEELSKTLAELPELVIGLCDAGDKLFSINVDDSAAHAGHFLVALQPTDGLLSLLAAVRKWNRDCRGIRDHIHDLRSSVSGDAHTVDQAEVRVDDACPRGKGGVHA